MTASSKQHTTVNLNGIAAELIRKVMRQTGWDVDASLAYVIKVADRTITAQRTAILDTQMSGNEVGVQVVSNTVTAYEHKIGDVVMVKTDLDDQADDEGDVLKLYGKVTGFAPQGIEVELTDRSIDVAKGYHIHVNKLDLWDVSSVEML